MQIFLTVNYPLETMAMDNSMDRMERQFKFPTI